MARLNQLWLGCSGTVHVSGIIDKTMRVRFVTITICLFALAFPVQAAERRGAPSLDRVLPQIRHSVPGTFYDAEGPFLGANGQASYRIKWMTPDGRIIWFAVDARSGKIMGAAPSAQSRYRAEEDYPPRSAYRDDEPPSRYGDRDGYGGWDRGASRGSNQGWERDDRERSPSAGGRYERGASPERSSDRSTARAPERGPDRSTTRPPDRGSDRSPDRSGDRGRDRGRDQPRSRR